ncbi:uncharacterized protein LOC144714876 [Wolffia australiana]
MAASARAVLRASGRSADRWSICLFEAFGGRRCPFSSCAISPSFPAPALSSLPITSPSCEQSPGLVVPSGPYLVEGSMELMAVPKKKVSPYKRGLRNGPKALKPVPVIVRCKSCGRVKLPHFYCCSGDRRSPGEGPTT